MYKDSIISYLKKLDLSDVEAKLYITLLETGPVSVRQLAETIDIKRTTTYFYIDQLIEKGLLMKILQGSKKLISANNPDSISSLVDQKINTANQLKKGFPDLLKSIETIHPNSQTSDDADIKYFKGINGVKKIYEEALKARELRSYFNFELIKEALPDNEVLFVQALRNNKDITIYELLQDTPLSRDILKASRTVSQNPSRYMFKFLPNGVALSAADILIYDGHVGIINVGNQYNGTVIKNMDYYNNSKEFFDLIWKILPETQI